MRIEEIEIKGVIIWLVLDQLRMYNQDKTIQLFDNYLCYFKLTEPTPFIYGELFRDDNGKPLLFYSIEEAIQYAKNNLVARF